MRGTPKDKQEPRPLRDTQEKLRQAESQGPLLPVCGVTWIMAAKDSAPSADSVGIYEAVKLAGLGTPFQQIHGCPAQTGSWNSLERGQESGRGGSEDIHCGLLS